MAPSSIADQDDDNDNSNDVEFYENDNEPPRIDRDMDDPVDTSGRLLNQQSAYDRLISAEVSLQLGSEIMIGRVRGELLIQKGKLLENMMIIYTSIQLYMKLNSLMTGKGVQRKYNS